MTNESQILKRLFEIEGDDPEKIELTLKYLSEKEKSDKWNSIPGWIGAITGMLALIVSIIVAIYK